MPVQRRKLTAWLQSGLKNQGPSLRALKNLQALSKSPNYAGYKTFKNRWSKGGKAGAQQQFRKDIRYKRMLIAKHGRSGSLPAKTGGGGGSRSEAARKAWRTRRGH